MQIKPTFFGLFPLFRPPLLARQGDPPSPQRRRPGWLLRQHPGKRLLPKRRKKSPSGTIYFHDFLVLVLRAHNNSLTPTVCTVWHIFTLNCQHPTTAKPGPRSRQAKKDKSKTRIRWLRTISPSFDMRIWTILHFRHWWFFTVVQCQRNSYVVHITIACFSTLRAGSLSHVRGWPKEITGSIYFWYQKKTLVKFC